MCTQAGNVQKRWYVSKYKMGGGGGEGEDMGRRDSMTGKVHAGDLFP